MDIARYFIEKKVTSWLVAILLLVGGIFSFSELGRLEDPEFSIKSAQIITQYPGASAIQVEEEISAFLERELMNLPYIDKITSTSITGQSSLSIKLKNTVAGDSLGQVWDELRKKVRDIEPRLPSGSQSPKVVDDFADVYGILLALSSDKPNDFSYREMNRVAEDLRRELSLIDGVAKVAIAGAQPKQVEIEIPRNSLVSLGLPADQIALALSEQNLVTNSGQVDVGQQTIHLESTGEFTSIDELGLLSVSHPKTGESFKLKDIATIRYAYRQPSNHIIHQNGKPALALGVSFLPGENVVEVGQSIRQSIESNAQLVPAGINIEPIYYQSDEVEKAVDSFLLSLIQAVVIVIVVLLIFMGLKSGLLIGMILVITIYGTFIFMNLAGITLQRVSLGGLIIALGMLVDNAIVVTEGVLIGIQRGKSRLQAASDVVLQTKWPLAGATVIAIAAFAPIGLSQDSTGEFVGSLFWVLLISLSLSWFTAISLTPFFCHLLFKENTSNDNEEPSDPYQGVIYTGYKRALGWAMTHRLISIVLLAIALAISLVNFKNIKQAFFPASNTTMFFIDMRHPTGTNMAFNEQQVTEIETWLVADDRVASVSTTIAKGFPRFLLTYSAVETGAENAQMVVRTHDLSGIDSLMVDAEEHLKANYPDLMFKQRKMQFGPGGGSKLEVRLIGDDPVILRELAEQVKAVYRAQPYVGSIRDSWKQPVKVLQPVYDGEKGSSLGISKKDYDEALYSHLHGKRVGRFSDGSDQLPIVMTVPADERADVSDIKDIQIYANGRYVSIEEVTNGWDTIWADPNIPRLEQQRVMTVMADPVLNSPLNANELFKVTRVDIGAIELPAGYQLEFGGEYEKSKDSRGNMTSAAPMGYLFMFIITLLLFNSVRETLVVWLCIPLILIGITSGFLMLDIAFGFMGFLGLLSLSGMVIKNGIVLIDQVNVELCAGKNHFDAMTDAAVSRVRPVAMAALTTVFGLTPLFIDPFFQDMAVVIGFGLGFATVLTLIAVPVFYVSLYRPSLSEHSSE